MKFREYLDKVTNRLTCFGIFNALLIFSLTAIKTTITVFLSGSFIVLSLLVLYTILEEAFEKEEESDLNSSIDGVQYFVFFITISLSFLGFIIYSIILIPFFLYAISVGLALFTGAKILDLGGVKSIRLRIKDEVLNVNLFASIILILLLSFSLIAYFIIKETFSLIISFILTI